MVFAGNPARSTRFNGGISWSTSRAVEIYGTGTRMTFLNVVVRRGRRHVESRSGTSITLSGVGEQGTEPGRFSGAF